MFRVSPFRIVWSRATACCLRISHDRSWAKLLGVYVWTYLERKPKLIFGYSAVEETFQCTNKIKPECCYRVKGSSEVWRGGVTGNKTLCFARHFSHCLRSLSKLAASTPVWIWEQRKWDKTTVWQLSEANTITWNQCQFTHSDTMMTNASWDRWGRGNKTIRGIPHHQTPCQSCR